MQYIRNEIKFILLFLICVFTSCRNVNSYQENLVGTYINSQKFGYAKIILMIDKTFIYKRNEMGVVMEHCSGEWEVTNGNSLLLKCDERKDITALLSMGTMEYNELIVMVLSKNKIRFKDKTLRKVNH